MSNFTYSIDYIDFSAIKTKKNLINLLERHDKDSFLFSMNTGQLNMALGKELGVTGNDLYMLFQCGVFHDVGKLGMSNEFINYPGAFTFPMYVEMKKHTVGGAEILTNLGYEKELIETAHYHHCNFDGSGYPGEMYYKEIPLHARITRVSDSVDAYMSKRCYKDSSPTKGVLEDLLHYKGTSYDPDVLEAYSAIHKKVMTECRINGFDDPSQDIYMHYISQFYGDEEKNKFLIENDL